MGTPTLEVAAGLVFRAGKLLITRRKADAHLGGLWEFPGGKREAHETLAQCLVRELHEELGVTVAVGELFASVRHAYPGRRVLLNFFLCQLIRGEPQPLDCAAVQWVSRTELREYAFPAADAQLLTKLQAAGALWSEPPAG
ncbi:MAG TPA: 8-oxo-dGTP diphosphatase MutT [Verrucomicrobiota bacterium]|nr:8-oxo-dGTP diphosphatase MutT [Verrucomicrobiota bacterium]HNT13280.1 8-oxo-dGTP diphosphatase MutT [Verrucomicrobiota bacterium]